MNSFPIFRIIKNTYSLQKIHNCNEVIKTNLGIKKRANIKGIYISIWLLVFLQTIEESGLAHLIDYNYTNPLVNMSRLFLLIACLAHNKFKLCGSSKKIIDYTIFSMVVIVDLLYGSMTFFDVFIVVIFIDDLEYYRTIFTFWSAVLTAFILIVTFSLFGLIPEYQFYRNGGNVRITLGFQHPNLLAINVLALIILYILIRKRNKGGYRYAILEAQLDWWDITVCILAAAFCYIIPNSITETIILSMLAVIIILLKLRKLVAAKTITQNKLFKFASIIMIPLLAIGVRYLVVNSRFDLLPDMGATFSNRLLYAVYAYDAFGIHLFPVPQEEYNLFKISNLIGNDIDCLYIKILIRYGILLTLYFLCMCIRMLTEYLKKENTLMSIMIVILFVFSLMENRILSNSKFSFLFICALSVQVNIGHCKYQKYQMSNLEK